MAKFKYKKRSTEAVDRRGKQKAGKYDSIFSEGVTMFSPAKGDNILRIMPGTFEGSDEHYGMDVYVHYGVGTDNQSYLCPNKMLDKPCPICEELARVQNGGDDDYIRELKPTKRVLVYVIDRENEKEGPKVWSMPWTIDRDLALASKDKKTGEVLLIDDPENGYDISFTKEGAGVKTKYNALGIDRRDSFLSDDEKTEEEWLDFIVENPLDKLLNYYDYDRIAKVFNGGEVSEPEEEVDEEPPTRRRRKRSIEEEENIPEDVFDRKKPIDDAEESLDEEPAKEEPVEEEKPKRRRRKKTEEEPVEEEEVTEEEPVEEEEKPKSNLRERLRKRKGK